MTRGLYFGSATAARARSRPVLILLYYNSILICPDCQATKPKKFQNKYAFRRDWAQMSNNIHLALRRMDILRCFSCRFSPAAWSLGSAWLVDANGDLVPTVAGLSGMRLFQTLRSLKKPRGKAPHGERGFSCGSEGAHDGRGLVLTAPAFTAHCDSASLASAKCAGMRPGRV